MPIVRPPRFLAPAFLTLLLVPRAAFAADGAPPMGELALRAGLALAAVLGAIALLAWLLRRLSPSAIGASSGKRLVSVARLDLGARRELRLVRADGHLVLLGVTPDRVELLRDVTADGAEAAPESDAGLRVLPKLTTS